MSIATASKFFDAVHPNRPSSRTSLSVWTIFFLGAGFGGAVTFFWEGGGARYKTITKTCIHVGVYLCIDIFHVLTAVFNPQFDDVM